MSRAIAFTAGHQLPGNTRQPVGECNRRELGRLALQ